MSDVFVDGPYPDLLPSTTTHHTFSTSSFYPPDDTGITDSPQARALAASHNHKEAEKRRRERINSHLDRLRTLLPCSSKTDKATLLAKVIQKLRELKQETSEIIQVETFPSETDEITVLSNNNSTKGRLLIKVSVCCEDRPDLITNLVETLKSLGLSLLTAEIVTFGGRVRNVIVVECVREEGSAELVKFLKEALRSFVHRPGLSSGDRSKRRRIFDHIMK